MLKFKKMIMVLVLVSLLMLVLFEFQSLANARVVESKSLDGTSFVMFYEKPKKNEVRNLSVHRTDGSFPIEAKRVYLGNGDYQYIIDASQERCVEYTAYSTAKNEDTLIGMFYTSRFVFNFTVCPPQRV